MQCLICRNDSFGIQEDGEVDQRKHNTINNDLIIEVDLSNVKLPNMFLLLLSNSVI